MVLQRNGIPYGLYFLKIF